MAGSERRKDRDRRRIRQMIENQEVMNNINEILKDKHSCTQKLRKQIEILMKGEEALWLF